MTRRSERDKMTYGSPAEQADMAASEFAAATPDVPAERIRCTECSTKYIGDPEKSTICPECRIEMGIEMFPEGDA